MARFNKVVALAKIETTYGVDSVPTGAANALLLQDVEAVPMEAERIERPLIRPYFGARPQVLGGKRFRLQAGVDFAGSGTAGTAPAYGPLLRACGMAEAINAGTNVTYTPISDAEPSLSIHFNLDGTRHVALGARGTFGLELASRRFPVLRFDFMGFYAAPTAVALPATTLTAWQDPSPVGFVDTPVATLDGFACTMESFSLTFGAQVAYRDLVGARTVMITDRQPSATIEIEAPALGSKDFFALANAQTPVALNIEHGLTAGRKGRVELPRAQILNPSYVNNQGIVHLRMDLVPLPNAGNDEIRIIVL